MRRNKYEVTRDLKPAAMGCVFLLGLPFRIPSVQSIFDLRLTQPRIRHLERKSLENPGEPHVPKWRRKLLKFTIAPLPRNQET